jgi:glycosyltransferase involved in cell wall biosynthesis
MIATKNSPAAKRTPPRAAPQGRPAEPGGWVHLCNGLDPVRHGGMVPSILGMTAALSRKKGRLKIMTLTPARLDHGAIKDGVSLHGPESDLEHAIRSAEVVHLHGLWQAQTRRGARAARAACIPYVITAHGMADPWALKHKRWKKQVYLALVEARNLRHASCLHALSRLEIDHLLALAPRTPICFVPNGVDLAPYDRLPPRAVLEDEYPVLKGKFVLLFFGRAHVKKGLDLLAEALGRIAPDRPELHLLVAGHDAGAWPAFRDRMAELNLSRRMTYVGHVAGARAQAVWGAADAFVLPSYSEGFSMAVLEALACRLPCLITTACHFPELASAGGGIVVAPDESAISAGLYDLIDRAPAERESMAENGRRLVEERYTWDRQGERLAAVYQWLCGGGPPPEAVVA